MVVFFGHVPVKSHGDGLQIVVRLITGGEIYIGAAVLKMPDAVRERYLALISDPAVREPAPATAGDQQKEKHE